eukprot:3383327-Karenia_brevis.AAC.1
MPVEELWPDIAIGLSSTWLPALDQMRCPWTYQTTKMVGVGSCSSQSVEDPPKSCPTTGRGGD